MNILYNNETYQFILKKTEGEGKTGARIIRIQTQSPSSSDCPSGTSSDKPAAADMVSSEQEEIVLFDYFWPAQLTVEVEAGEAFLREDGVLCWQLHVTAHHVRGMAQGEFTETEWFEAERPFGTAQELVCRTADIVRKTRFAIAERHLKHLPHQTYPPVDGLQGPYGHP